MSVTKIWLWIDVSFGHTNVYSNSGHWHFLAAKFWLLTYPCISILVTDISLHLNSGHWLPTQFWSHCTNVFSEACIARIFCFLSWFEAEKGFLKTLFHVQGVYIYDIWIFFWPRLGPSVCQHIRNWESYNNCDYCLQMAALTEWIYSFPAFKDCI